MNPKLILAIAVLALLIASNAFVAWKFYGFGQDNIQTKWNKAVVAATESKIDTRTKQDEIRNAPIDNAVTDRRLLNGSF